MSKVNFFLFFFYLICTQLTFPDNTFLNKVRNSINSIKPFKVKFINQFLTENEVELEESGEVLFKDIRMLKWTYLDPDYKVWILIGDDYKFYDRENEQLTIGKIEKKNQKWIWQLLFSEEVSEFIRSDEKKMKIFIKDESESIDLEVSINKKFLPEKIIQIDPSGAKLVYYFKEYEKKIKIDDKEFELKVPENVDIIETQ